MNIIYNKNDGKFYQATISFDENGNKDYDMEEIEPDLNKVGAITVQSF